MVFRSSRRFLDQIEDIVKSGAARQLAWFTIAATGDVLKTALVEQWNEGGRSAQDLKALMIAGCAVGWFLIATAVLSIPSFVSMYGLEDPSLEAMVGVYVAIGAALLWAAGPRRGALALLAGSGGILLAVLYRVAVSGQGLAFYVSNGVGPTHVLWAFVLYVACLIAIVAYCRVLRDRRPSPAWFIISFGVGIEFLMCGTLTGWQNLSFLPWYDTSHPVSDLGLLAVVLVFWAVAWRLWRLSWRGNTSPAGPPPSIVQWYWDRLPDSPPFRRSGSSRLGRRWTIGSIWERQPSALCVRSFPR